MVQYLDNKKKRKHIQQCQWHSIMKFNLGKMIVALNKSESINWVSRSVFDMYTGWTLSLVFSSQTLLVLDICILSRDYVIIVSIKHCR